VKCAIKAFINESLPCVECVENARQANQFILNPGHSQINAQINNPVNNTRAPRRTLSVDLPSPHVSPERQPSGSIYYEDNQPFYKNILIINANIKTLLLQGLSFQSLTSVLTQISIEHLVNVNVTCDVLQRCKISMTTVADCIDYKGDWLNALVKLNVESRHFDSKFIDVKFIISRANGDVHRMRRCFGDKFRIEEILRMKFSADDLKSMGYTMDRLYRIGFNMYDAQYIFSSFQQMVDDFRLNKMIFHIDIFLEEFDQENPVWPPDKEYMEYWIKNKILQE